MTWQMHSQELLSSTTAELSQDLVDQAKQLFGAQFCHLSELVENSYQHHNLGIAEQVDHK
jgi:hypothetical protein